ncbi:DUF1651 domain-containing protein [Cyanobium sp. ATX 6E8]|uniref:DUF1651 domain-containing protein n=1 Tax=Cyanobium sp. ATX 6E8 TaxID=2823701 RepID=UPI003965830E
MERAPDVLRRFRPTDAWRTHKRRNDARELWRKLQRQGWRRVAPQWGLPLHPPADLLAMPPGRPEAEPISGEGGSPGFGPLQKI